MLKDFVGYATYADVGAHFEKKIPASIPKKDTFHPQIHSHSCLSSSCRQIVMFFITTRKKMVERPNRSITRERSHIIII